jgi:hypothetical protein
MNQENVLLAFGLTLLAGLSTGIGSGLAFFTKRTNVKFLSVALGFSAGVMIYISLVDIFAKARLSLAGVYGETKGSWVTVAAFFGGIFLIAAIDRLVPSGENPHEARTVEEMECQGKHPCVKRLLRSVGVLVLIHMNIHKFFLVVSQYRRMIKEKRYCMHYYVIKIQGIVLLKLLLIKLVHLSNNTQPVVSLISLYKPVRLHKLVFLPCLSRSGQTLPGRAYH